ncbi:hypothetical protein ACRALDRAFT_2045038 [Sodiomyces alcalophilus JCM 7366]|uniref:uncharacterized protein n=1 Tax=Sodiomyces alcalophilus JCM 7366 TaxID=591952 RepID=UPI0039B68B3B
MSCKKRIAILQKAYDDSYLKCSTAVYYESQGNEVEAMRCWTNALDEIVDPRVTEVLLKPTSQSETESALIESLHALELQCRERIDLLKVLRLSRQEQSQPPSTSSSGSNLHGQKSRPSSSPSQDKGWIGDGTIPAVTYPELSRPATMGGTKEKEPRPSSPEKYTMRTTLRSAKPGSKTTKLSNYSACSKRPGANRAATLAWNALTSRDRLTGGGGVALAGEPSASRHSIQALPERGRKPSTPLSVEWDTHTRRLIPAPQEMDGRAMTMPQVTRNPGNRPYARAPISVSAASSALNPSSAHDTTSSSRNLLEVDKPVRSKVPALGDTTLFWAPHNAPSGSSDTEDSNKQRRSGRSNKTVVNSAASLENDITTRKEIPEGEMSSHHDHEIYTQPAVSSGWKEGPLPRLTHGSRGQKGKRKAHAHLGPFPQSLYADPHVEYGNGDRDSTEDVWQRRKVSILKTLPPAVDKVAASQILDEIVVEGDEVHWDDIAGLEIAKNALRETVVYPFLRPDLFMGLREPARGMLLFGPPGTGKTMLARAVATESQSTFFSISASSLTSKYLGESEKLVRALFSLAKELAPSIIFVDEIDSLLSQRSNTGEHEATRRLKTEFLIQWSDLQRAAAGRSIAGGNGGGDPNRVLVLAATNLPWAIDEAARRRFVRRQYIPLPEPKTRSVQLRTLLGQQKHSLSETDIAKLVDLTDGFSGSDITALAKDAAMGPLRSVGDALLHMTMEDIRPILFSDFESSLSTIRPSVSKAGLKEYEDWAKMFGERGG